MDDEQLLAAKAEALRGLGTKELIEQIKTKENELEDALRTEAEFKKQNSGFLASTGSDCQTVKQLLALLSASAPEIPDPKDETKTKKMTATELNSWLVRQRTENPELKDAIAKQEETAFLLEHAKIQIEMCKKRLDSQMAVLSLKTAQIKFLS